MKITILCVGKLKEKYLVDAIGEYAKRLKLYTKLQFIYLQDEKAPENLSPADKELIKLKEGKKILSNINERDFVIALAIEGNQLTSEQFANFINSQMINSITNLTFVIGGSLGLSDNVMSRSNYKLSFSKMTLPHQLMQLILIEQIYRGFKIIRCEPYHK